MILARKKIYSQSVIIEYNQINPHQLPSTTIRSIIINLLLPTHSQLIRLHHEIHHYLLQATSSSTLLQSNLSPSITTNTITMNNEIFVQTTFPLIGVDKLYKPIISDHLIIRPVLLSDLEPFHALLSQPKVMPSAYIGAPYVRTKLQQTLAHIASLQTRGPEIFCITSSSWRSQETVKVT